ncbi:MAG: hypothetical protein QW320_06550 [Ignisphaera sp.]|uniref:hypothetical protein n=1 Tax=Thermofilum sp. TaxID=1961369 RepID=UPI00316A8A3C
MHETCVSEEVIKELKSKPYRIVFECGSGVFIKLSDGFFDVFYDGASDMLGFLNSVSVDGVVRFLEQLYDAYANAVEPDFDSAHSVRLRKFIVGKGLIDLNRVSIVVDEELAKRIRLLLSIASGFDAKLVSFEVSFKLNARAMTDDYGYTTWHEVDDGLMVEFKYLSKLGVGFAGVITEFTDGRVVDAVRAINDLIVSYITLMELSGNE